MLRRLIQDDIKINDIAWHKDGTLVLDFLLAVELDRSSLKQVRHHLMRVALIDGGSFLQSEREVYDLRFGLVVREADRVLVESPPDFTAGGVRAVVSKDDRSNVLSLVCRSTQLLVKLAMPINVTMSTYYAHLPERALRKYEIIGNALADCGYVCIDAYRNSRGYDRWVFRS